MVNPSNSDSKIPPKPANDDRVRKSRPYTSRDFKEAMKDENHRASRQTQERGARAKEKGMRGSPMSLAKQAPRTGTKGTKGKVETTSEDKVKGDEELLSEQEEVEEAQEQAQAKGAQSKKEKKPVSHSPFALFQKGANKEDTAVASLEKGSKEKSGGRTGEARGDLAAMSPFGGQSSAPASIGTSVETKQQASVAEIQALVDQMVDKLYTVQKGDEMNTVVVLKQPPIFEDANLVITGFKSAGKEFNITFENLRPDAKALLDNNIQALRTGLVEKGIVQAVHIITTTTQIEHLPGATGQPPSRDRDQREGQQQRQDRQRDDRHPDDEEG